MCGFLSCVGVLPRKAQGTEALVGLKRLCTHALGPHHRFVWHLASSTTDNLSVQQADAISAC